MTNKCWLSHNPLGGGNNIRLEYVQYCSQQLPGKWDVSSFQDLCTHPCNMGLTSPCCYMSRWARGLSSPQDLRIWPGAAMLGVQNICHSPSVTMVHSIGRQQAPHLQGTTHRLPPAPDVRVLVWSGYTASVVARLIGCTVKLSLIDGSGGQSCRQHSSRTRPQKLTSVAAHVRVSGLCWGQPEAHLCNNHAVWAAPWYYLHKGKDPLTQI